MQKKKNIINCKFKLHTEQTDNFEIKLLMESGKRVENINLRSLFLINNLLNTNY